MTKPGDTFLFLTKEVNILVLLDFSKITQYIYIYTGRPI